MGVVIVMMIFLIMPVFAWVMPFFVMLDVFVVGDAFEVGLEFAMPLPLRERADLHVDVSPRHLGILIDVAHGQEVLFDLERQGVPEFLVSHLAATELKLDADFVAFCQEVFGVHDLDLVIMRVDADAEFHLLHLATLLVLVSFLLVLLLRVFVFAVIDDLAHGRISRGSDFDEI